MTGGYEDLPDAPDIARAERTGLRPGEVPFDEEDVLCPCCNSVCDTLYKTLPGEIVGCDHCVKAMDAWTWYVAQRMEEHEDGR